MSGVVEKLAVETIDLEKIFSAKTLDDRKVLLWPENRLNTHALTNDLLDKFSAIRNEDLAGDDSAVTIVDVIRFFWIGTIVSHAYNRRLAEGIVGGKLRLDCSTRYPRLWDAICNVPQSEPRYIEMLQLGPPRYRKWRWPLRLMRQAVKRPIVRMYPWPEVGRDNEIITLNRGSLIDSFAETHKVRPRYCDPDVWFAAVSVNVVPAHRDLASKFVDAAELSVRSYGIELRRETVDWLRQQFETSAALIDCHIRRLRSSKKIPKELWVGSSSSFWPRLLAKEVMRRGGKVIAFDHGFGSGYFNGVDVPRSIEPFCSEFVTTSKIQAQQIQKYFKSEAAAGEEAVMAIYLECADRLERAPSSFARTPSIEETRIKTLMVLPLPLMGEPLNLMPYPDDWWVQDLNRRLLADLSATGLKILVKPHPEFNSEELARIAGAYGAEIIDGRFEDTSHLADGFLFTHPLTTTLHFARNQRLPVALIDFGLVDWRANMRAHLEREVTFVDGEIGADNRLTYRFDEIQNFLD